MLNHDSRELVPQASCSLEEVVRLLLLFKGLSSVKTHQNSGGYELILTSWDSYTFSANSSSNTNSLKNHSLSLHPHYQ